MRLLRDYMLGSTFRVYIPFGYDHLPPSQIKRIVNPLRPRIPYTPRDGWSSNAGGAGPDMKEPDEPDAAHKRADARSYSKTASWWLPSIATLPATARSSSSQSSESVNSSSTPSPSFSLQLPSSYDLPPSPRSRTASSFCMAPPSRSRRRRARWVRPPGSSFR